MGFFDFIGESAQWIGDRISDADDWVNDRLKDAGNWFSDFYHGNLGDQALPAPAIVQQVQQGPGTSSWDSGSSMVQKMIQEHNQNSDDAQQITTMLESVWTGDGADAARARLRPLSDASSTSAQAYVVNGQKLVDTTHGYNDMKIALQAMPPTPPHKNLWDQGTPWDTDTEKQINEYNAAANHNVERYQKYADQAKTNGQGLNSNYGQVSGFDGQNLKIDSGEDRGKGKTGSHEKVYRKGGQDSGGPGSGPGASGGLGSGPWTVDGPGTSGPGTSGPGTSGPGTGGLGGSGSGVTGGPGGVSYPPGGVTVPPGYRPGEGDGTSTAGWTPPSVDRGGGSSWTPSTPTSWGNGTGTGTGTGNSGGSTWTPGGFGPFGGAGETAGRSGGIAARLGGGAGAGTGVGAGAGVGAGEEGAARSGAAAAGKGAAGAKGAPGMGGMAGAGKGKGEEDKEHQRKYGIDDDSAFSLVDENGERTLDPRTGLPPTPPTIGG
ncbi:hypothetical protein [Amycolatopsis sp. Poz14]|uniref:hypothetical protein n=1 Tax=Amycolatopsis sp. Poz14 TaxID=1447705 RepID=UPI001EE8E818|nr:hypothetical protein [Amycolatopsis sp. Poz14]MCG3757668.1 hypothetical protein [Amycolatopsis sp. Poz14]